MKLRIRQGDRVRYMGPNEIDGIVQRIIATDISGWAEAEVDWDEKGPPARLPLGYLQKVPGTKLTP